MDSTELAWRIRRHGVEMTHRSGASHIGSILSVADIVAVLYSGAARLDPRDPSWPDRDRIILSKGHAGAAIYATLAETGFFELSELGTHYTDGSKLSGHVSHRGVPGVELSTGSLGHGLSVGAGMAYAARKNDRHHRVYVIMSDGECDEGSVWEAALVASHHGLRNLVAVVDHNGMQGLGRCEDTIALEPFAAKWHAFGWNVIEVDGHDHPGLRAAFEASPASDRPTAILAHTVKGKGVSFMEDDLLWHYRYPHEGEEYDAAVEELSGRRTPAATLQRADRQ
ncbi:MAG TPA: transketolase [Actinomycetaceae bacterium]|nr:transketolase [Actinomycetaceae bacterium]